jgi:hypothetical protein
VYGYGASGGIQVIVANSLVPRIKTDPASGADLCRMGSTTPSAARISIDLGWQPSAREAAVGDARRSMIRHRTPLRASVRAVTKPVGPAPTTSTTGEYMVAVRLVQYRRNLGNLCLSDIGAKYAGVKARGDVKIIMAINQMGSAFARLLY